MLNCDCHKCEYVRSITGEVEFHKATDKLHESITPVLEELEKLINDYVLKEICAGTLLSNIIKCYAVLINVKCDSKADVRDVQRCMTMINRTTQAALGQRVDVEASFN